MVDFRDDYKFPKPGEYSDQTKGASGGALIALLLVVLSLIAIFWYASGTTPENGTAGPAIEATPPAQVVPEDTVPAVPAE